MSKGVRLYLTGEEMKARRRRLNKESKERRKQEDTHDYRRDMIWGMRTKAKRKGIPCDRTITFEEINIPTRCPCCNIMLIRATGYPTRNSPSLDKIIPHLGYVRGNIQVICNRCNTIKQDASFEELVRVAEFFRGIVEGYANAGRIN